MFGIALYLAVAVIAAVAMFLLAEWTREPGVRAPDHPGRVALFAGLAWPLVLIGVIQFALVVAVGNRWGGRPAPAVRMRVGSSAEAP